MLLRSVSVLLLVLAGLLFQCQSDNNSASATTTEAAETTESTPVAPVTPAVVETPYPSITQEKMRYLYDNCDYVDFIFYGTNFSMSQKEQNAIRSTLAGVATNPATALSTCQAIGRVFFQVDGKNEAEADLFFGNECLYYLWLEDGTYKYGNGLTQEGFEFYQKIFASVSTQPAQ
ncbi:MAG: hypothetical protein AAGJ82_03820 [Bacteroidota bacterium]